jgi:hypothetical protein
LPTKCRIAILKAKGADEIIPIDWLLRTLKQAGPVQTLPKAMVSTKLYKAYVAFERKT